MVHGKYDIVILERLDQLFIRCFLKTQSFTGRIKDIALGALISIILEIAIQIMAERLSVIQRGVFCICKVLEQAVLLLGACRDGETAQE